jgi:hypothetical protein
MAGMRARGRGARLAVGGGDKRALLLRDRAHLAASDRVPALRGLRASRCSLGATPSWPTPRCALPAQTRARECGRRRTRNARRAGQTHKTCIRHRAGRRRTVTPAARRTTRPVSLLANLGAVARGRAGPCLRLSARVSPGTWLRVSGTGSQITGLGPCWRGRICREADTRRRPAAPPRRTESAGSRPFDRAQR